MKAVCLPSSSEKKSISQNFLRQNKVISCLVWCPLIIGIVIKQNMNMYYLLIFSFSNVPSSTFCGPPWLFFFQNTRWTWITQCAMKHLLLLLKICADRFYSIISLKLHNGQCHYGFNPLPGNLMVGNFYCNGNQALDIVLRMLVLVYLDPSCIFY